MDNRLTHPIAFLPTLLLLPNQFVSMRFVWLAGTYLYLGLMLFPGVGFYSFLFSEGMGWSGKNAEAYNINGARKGAHWCLWSSGFITNSTIYPLLSGDFNAGKNDIFWVDIWHKTKFCHPYSYWVTAYWSEKSPSVSMGSIVALGAALNKVKSTAWVTLCED